MNFERLRHTIVFHLFYRFGNKCEVIYDAMQGFHDFCWKNVNAARVNDDE